MNTYIVTLEGAKGEVEIEADGFRCFGEGDLVFYREGEPITEPLPADLPDAKPYTYRVKTSMLAYAAGVWRTVMEKGATATFIPAQGRAPRENPERRQKT